MERRSKFQATVALASAGACFSELLHSLQIQIFPLGGKETPASGGKQKVTYLENKILEDS